MYESYMSEGVQVVGVSNTNNTDVINQFVTENSLTFPIIYDTGSSGGVQGGDVYDLYYMPNDGSPYPRDFVVDQDGVLQYANNEIDTEWMIYVIETLIGADCDGLSGDINQDQIVNILDVIILVNTILNTNQTEDVIDCILDLNQDGQLDILDVIVLINLIVS
ncbi:MAG: hypothetical protein CBD58_02270 [bacterium TMED198]|nr:MAG: hypothetical protein CBD58_02270 [bacterium TMED198]